MNAAVAGAGAVILPALLCNRPGLESISNRSGAFPALKCIEKNIRGATPTPTALEWARE
jgi:hypothetical protein